VIFSIVIPCLEFSSSQNRLLSTCLDQNLGSDNFEIQIVYHTSKIDTPSNKKNVLFTRVPFKNVSAARNLGVEKSNGKFILFLDDDTLPPEKHYLCDLLQALESLGDSAIVGGGYKDSQDSRFLAKVHNAITNLWLAAGKASQASPHGFYQTQILVGGVLASRRETFLEVRFPEEISWGGEDTAFAGCAKQNHKNLFFSHNLSVTHATNPSWRKFILRTWRSGQVPIKYGITNISLLRKIEILKGSRKEIRGIYIPFMFLHFCLLEISKIYYRCRRYNPKNKR